MLWHLSRCHLLNLHPTPDKSTTQSDLQTPRLILTPRRLIWPRERSWLPTPFSALCVVAILCSRERERCHCKPPHLPLLLIRTVCADALKNKMSAYLPRRCVSPHLLLLLLLLLLHSSSSFFWIFTFLALLAARQEDIDCPSINFHSRAPLGNWLHFGRDCCKVQAGDNLIAQLLSKLKRRAI